jgi:Tol biopolymer transport system component
MSIAKKIFIISSVLLAAVLFFLGIYNVSFREKSEGEKAIQEIQEEKKKSIVEKVEEKINIKKREKIFSLSTESVLGPVVLPDEEKINYYTRLNGNVYSSSFYGEEKELKDDNNFSGLEGIRWSSERNKVISRFNKGGKIEIFVYDYETKKAVKLNEGVADGIWGNSENEIIYSFFDQKSGKKTLNMADAQGGNWKKITDIPFEKSSMSLVPKSSFVSFWNSANAFEETSLTIVSVMGGEARKIFSGRFGADYLWSSNGTKALVSSSEVKGGQKISLGMINSNGGEYQNFNIPTFASKCAWSKNDKIVYYALPSIASEGLVLPNDYLNKKITTKDTFWKLDIGTGKNERIVETSDIKEEYDAENLFLSPSEDVLYFTNRNNGRLYGISL